MGRVWRPWVAPGWRPYTHGRWVWTSVGWTWVAYEPWGWIPHHFGHWAYAPAGWVWVPGTTWHPGNVTWVSHGGWVGWYPCAPRGWSHFNRGAHRGYSAGYAHGYGHGYDDGWRDARYATWVDWKHLGTAEDVSRHAVTHSRVTRLTAPGDVEILDRGPTRAAVEARTRQPVTRAALEHRSLKIDGRTVSVARPVGVAVDDGLRRSAPRTVETALAPAARQRPSDGAPASDSAVLTRTVRPETPRTASPATRSTVPAARSSAVVIDDHVVRSMRPQASSVAAVVPASRSRPAAPTRSAAPQLETTRPRPSVKVKAV